MAIPLSSAASIRSPFTPSHSLPNPFFSYEVTSSTKNRDLRCANFDEIEAEKSLIDKDVKEWMEKTIETVRENFNAVRTGRANPAMLDQDEKLGDDCMKKIDSMYKQTREED